MSKNNDESEKEFNEARLQANEILSGKRQGFNVRELIGIAERLRGTRQFVLARQLLDPERHASLLTGEPERQAFHSARAVAIYKDPELLDDLKLDQALHDLKKNLDLDVAEDPELLGVAGAICKRKWETTGHLHDLKEALTYYLRGWNTSTRSESKVDRSYPGINAAFILDLLATRNKETSGKNKVLGTMADQSQSEAKKIREEIIRLESTGRRDDYWHLVTMAEAHLGLGLVADASFEANHFDRARAFLEEAAGLTAIPLWQRETTVRQLSRLIRLHQPELTPRTIGDSAAGQAVRALIDNQTAPLETAFSGKIGLALSGGGFRASLFHIGVLARLAELDLLRRLDCISCVSGGSIIGAHYYLELRHLLQSKADGAITHQDYIDLVDRVAKDFLAGVQRNPRTLVAANLFANLKMMFSKNYSRTTRLGELYEKELFARVADEGRDRPRFMSDLKITPLNAKGARENDFSPREQNWLRCNKVPILSLNATTLNTGHNWQFTASWMGEPPGGIDCEVDANYRLRRMYYEQAPEPFKKIRLGEAVAASSCVPGLFEPVTLDKLYPDKTVRLVDGGVHDNQGAGVLLEQGCSVIIVSDASGQMEADDTPGHGILPVALRSNSILQARVREAQFRELDARTRSGLLEGFVFLHFKKDLYGEDISWSGSTDSVPVASTRTKTCYGILTEVQRLLAAIRTDLDSFSEMEGHALMVSGYRMAENFLAKSPVLTNLAATPLPDWRFDRWSFSNIEPQMTDPDRATELVRHLKVSQIQFLKVWHLSPILNALRKVGMPIIMAIVCLLAIIFWNVELTIPLPTVGTIALWLLPLIAVGLTGWKIFGMLDFRSWVRKLAIALVTATLGWLLVTVHLWVFDKLFLFHGRVRR
ncbi:MAG: patatin-like phospholipase family protein [Magnetococcales bacterium]|nr:patatin-like phospholipase family protein [Magnetococcales bacterium]